MNKHIKKALPLLVGKHLELLFFFNKQKALVQAFTFFCTPRKGRVLPEQEHFLEEAFDDILHIEDLKIQSYSWPNHNKETILLVHGWESNTYRWKPLIELLHAQGYTILSLDAPAHGYSSGKQFNIPLYAACMDLIIQKHKPTYIIGHSIGGMTTLYSQYKFSYPFIQKIIALAPPSELQGLLSHFQNTLKLSDKFIKELDTYFKREFGFFSHEFSIANYVKDIDTPGLLIHDAYDDITPYSEALKISKSWKGVSFITTQNYGHSLFFEEVNEMILHFLKNKHSHNSNT
ncbi:alpha/beta hydrolase [Aquimarina sp. TRL1]|uniref:alpha/beta hydrolase n=1 Tax=Aquimarina sp. (strain TRL1) TaxID=2736252 RepID=UPI00158BE375|nr:alpha/beta hydrolase [Aquimarina sp. TRL1]QKX05593.1 alpha/beta hydrolase [Aquimarina sp. TRL1]